MERYYAALDKVRPVNRCDRTERGRAAAATATTARALQSPMLLWRFVRHDTHVSV